jgi:hypothetical protein
MKRALWLPLAALVWIACARDARGAWPYVNKKLTSKSVIIRKAVLLPAQVAFSKVGVKGTEGGLPQGEQLGESFYAAVSKEMALRGIEVLPNPLEQAKDDAAKYAIADLQARYDNVRVQVRKRPGRVEKGQVTLDDRVAKFEPGAAADILVFIRGTGTVLTPGRKAIGLATWNWFSLMSQFRGEVTFVDAKTGEVLAFLRFMDDRDMTQKSDERFRRSLREALHDVPLPLPPPKGK